MSSLYGITSELILPFVITDAFYDEDYYDETYYLT